MKSIIFIVALLLGFSAYGAEGDKMLSSLGERLLQAVTNDFDAVQIDSEEDSITLSHKTMLYHIHSIDRTGEVSETHHEETGPKSKGFIITTRRQTGEYVGAAVLPQTISRPYWTTYVTVLPVEQEQ